MDIKPLFGLCGALIAAMTSEFNDQVTSVALSDVRGALGISHDAGTWIESLYVSAEIVGMAISPWLLVTFTLRRWTLFAIALCGASSVLIPFSPLKIRPLCKPPGNATRRGAIDFLNVITAQAQLLQSENDLADSDTQIATYLVNLYRALGGGWEVADVAFGADSTPRQKIEMR